MTKLNAENKNRIVGEYCLSNVVKLK